MSRYSETLKELSDLEKHYKMLGMMIPIDSPTNEYYQNRIQVANCRISELKASLQTQLNELMTMARSVTLPITFEDWNAQDESGWTVAHEAALCRNLPKDFGKVYPELYGELTGHGTTVADVVYYKNTPE